MSRADKKKLSEYFIIAVSVIFLFTFFDYIIHNFLDSKFLWSVPFSYFTNKLIFGIPIFFALLVLLNKFLYKNREALVILITSLLLQLRYFSSESYSFAFALTYFFIHSIILYIVIKWFTHIREDGIL